MVWRDVLRRVQGEMQPVRVVHRAAATPPHAPSAEKHFPTRDRELQATRRAASALQLIHGWCCTWPTASCSGDLQLRVALQIPRDSVTCLTLTKHGPEVALLWRARTFSLSDEASGRPRDGEGSSIPCLATFFSPSKLLIAHPYNTSPSIAPLPHSLTCCFHLI